jgi:hypothetical protein
MRKFDLFPKMSESGQTRRTGTGGIITLLTFIFMVVAVTIESANRPVPIPKQEALLLPNSSDSSSIHFNITVAYPCHLLRVSVQDITENHVLDSKRSITRQRLDANLQPIEAPISDSDPKSLFSGCGGCLGSTYTKCCLTCFDIAASFKLQNKLVPTLHNVEQCDRDKRAIASGDTCRIIADISTGFSRGELLISAGGDLQMPVHFKHDLTYFGDNVNLSHWIGNLRFGPDFPGLSNPLDNAQWKQKGRGFFYYRYKTNLVPTIAQDGPRKVESVQYSASFSDKSITKTVSKRHPAIAFAFDTSPITVKLSVQKPSIVAWVTGLLAIVGGGFTIGGLIDSFVFRITGRRKVINT